MILIVAIANLALLSGCGSSSANQATPPPQAIVVTVLPSNNVSIQVGQSQQFTATVQNDPSNRGVTWSIGTSGCTAVLCGAIDATGKFTTSAAFHSSFNNLSIVATSVADPTKTAAVGVLIKSLIAVSVTPASISLQVGQSQQFTAIVQNDPSNSGVTWSIGTSGCTATHCGTVDDTGKYSAPAIIPYDYDGISIVATSVADPAKTGAGVASVFQPPRGVAVTPANATVQLNHLQHFTATSDQFFVFPAVTWSISGAGCAEIACGMIDSNGNYSAPPAAPNPPAVKVTATSVDNGSIAGSAIVNLGANPNNDQLNGHYAFLLNGIDLDGDFLMVGSITADGNGNITDGVVDFNLASSIVLPGPFSGGLNVPLTGMYSVGSDGRGSMTFFDSCGFCTPSQTFSFALSSFTAGVAGRAQMAETDGVWVSGGILLKQDATAFSTNAVSGGYAFALSTPNYPNSPNSVGPGDPCESLSANGRFTASAGSLSAGHTDVYTSHVGAFCNAQPIYAPDLTFGGTYAVSADGRGTAVLSFPGGSNPFLNFSFYVISASELFLIETDDCGPNCAEATEREGLSGVALQQSAGPFSAISLNGPSVFTLEDNTVANSLGVSIATFDGTGTVSGTSDAVADNTGVVSTIPFHGTFTVDANGLGRGVLAPSGDLSPRPFYLVSPLNGFILDSSTGQPGTLEPQSAAPFNNSSVSGNFVLNVQTPVADGPGLGNSPFVEGPGAGVVTADGAGALTGTVDAPDGLGGGIGKLFTGNYSVDANGRGTLSTTSTTGPAMNWILYMISPSKVLLRQASAGGAKALFVK